MSMSDTDGWKGRKLQPPGSLGWLVAQLRGLMDRVRALENAAPLRSASISEGGLAIKDGGNLTIQDGGDVVVRDGGDVIIEEGGSFRSLWADGTPGAAFGPLWLDADPEVTESIGLLVQASAADASRDVFRAKTVLGTGSKEVYVGQADNAGNVDVFFVYSDSTHISGDNGISVEAPSGQIVVEAGANLFLKGAEVFAQIPNITGSANLAIGGSPTTYGALRRIGSSLRYKVDVEPLDLSHLSADEIVDALQGVTWRDRGMVEEDPGTTLRIPGHIAEELHDAGLGAFVVYDEQGRPDAISYDRLTAALAQALRTTRDETAQLLATVTAQGEAIADLTARLEALEA
jgi:hypothetical protein